MKKIVSFIFAISFAFMGMVFLTACDETSFKGEVTNYTMELTYRGEQKCIFGKQKVDYYNGSNSALSVLEFHLYPNAFRDGAKFKPVSFSNQEKAYPNGLSYGHIEINGVKQGMNTLTYQITGEDENILRISLLKELFPEERITVEINFVSYLPNCYHRYGYGNETINLANFYPIACVIGSDGNFENSPYSANGDPFFSDMANYEVFFTYPAEFVLANTGDVLGTNFSKAEKVSKIRAEYVRDFAIVLSEKFQVLKQNEGGTEVSYFFYKDKNPQRSLETAVRALRTNNQLFGKYPYSTLQVVESNFVYGGMEYPNLVLISDSLASEDEYLNVIVHEVAHQWWYNLVGSDEYKNAWLDEGLTEFTTAVFYLYNEGYSTSYEQAIYRASESYNMFLNVYSGVFDKVDTSMNRELNQFATEPEYVYIIYVKGMLMFDTLKNVLGDDMLSACLRDYFSTYAYKNSTPEGLIECFEKISGRDLESFFNSWIKGQVVFM